MLVRKRFRNQDRKCKTYSGADVDSDHNLLMVESNFMYKKLKKTSKHKRKEDLA